MNISGHSLKFSSSQHVVIVVHFNDMENNSRNSLSNLDRMRLLFANTSRLAFLLHISIIGTQFTYELKLGYLIKEVSSLSTLQQF